MFKKLGLAGSCLLLFSFITFVTQGAEPVNIAEQIRKQNPALMAEAFLGHDAEVQRLLAAGEKPDQPNSHGQTALQLAASRGNASTVKILLAAGAKVNLADQAGTTALMLAAQHGSLEVTEMLLAKGAEVDAAHKTGFTPLMYAAATDHADVAGKLLAAGAGIARRDKEEQTPLIIAAINNSRKVSKLLLDAGASPAEKNKKGFSARQYAEASGDFEFIALFTGKPAPAAPDAGAGAPGGGADEEQQARNGLFFALRANAFRLAASQNPREAIKQAGCVSCPGYQEAWQAVMDSFADRSVPDESVKMFFAGAVLLVGQVSSASAVMAYYNPWFDGILLTEMVRSSATTASLSAKVQFVAGESWRDETVKTGDDILKLFHLREPLLLALARNYQAVESRFTAWYPPAGKGNFMVPDVARRSASSNEEMRPIIGRMIYQATSFKVLFSEPKKWVLPELSKLAGLLEKGDLTALRSFLSPQQDVKMLESICLLPQGNRSRLGPVFYAQGKDDTAIAGLITPASPRWVFAVQIRGDANRNECRIEVFDLLQSGKLIVLYNQK